MECLHTKLLQDTRTGQDCEFCRDFDPNFEIRETPDRLVTPRGNNTAAAHLTENGYVQHRALEIRIRQAVMTGSWQHVAR